MGLGRRLNVRVIVTTCMVVALTACGRGCGPKRTAGNGSTELSGAEAVFINQPVSFCWERPVTPKRGKVQILVDGSGSMVGFAKALPPLVTWVQQGVSQLQNSTLEIESSRICQFSQGAGIYGCADSKNQPPSYNHSGNTNLHEAIRSAQDYELTFILTDGVAATGGQSSGDCARGVDAACVAKALQSFVNPQSAAAGEGDRGIWIMPVVTNYNGKFYTEEPIVPSSFQSKETIDEIRSDIGVEATVQDPRTEGNSLVFTYNGPRALLLIVLSRWADVGRAAVQAVWERTSLNSIDRLQQIKGFSSPAGTLEPMEVYPGFLNPVQWKSLQESDEPGERRGTLDVFHEKDAAKSTVSLSCPKGGSSEGIYTLSGSTKTASQVSGCVPIRVLPAFNFKFRPSRDEDDADMGQILKGFERKGDNYTDLRVRLSCNIDSPRACGQNPIAAQWMAYMNYAEAADGLASAKGENVLQQQIPQLSTEHPSRQPHRIFAFLQTLETFYREVSQDQRSMVLARIDFCHKL